MYTTLGHRYLAYVTPPFFLKGVPSLLKTVAVTCHVTFVHPMLLVKHTVFVGPAKVTVFLRDVGVHQVHLVHVSSTWGHGIKLDIMLEILMD